MNDTHETPETQAGSSAGEAGYVGGFHEETEAEAARLARRVEEAKRLAAETGLSYYDACVLLSTSDDVEREDT